MSDQAHSITLKQIADEVRHNFITSHDEATFAKLCLIFDQNIPPNPDRSIEEYGEVVKALEKGELELAFQHLFVLRILAHKPAALVVQIAIIWLAGHGWEKMSLSVLSALILVVRDFDKIEDS